jgi:2-polyprenyl-3-methyl-5-hydroxy-6-metoxy-1,4-benzoquinol methylase
MNLKTMSRRRVQWHTARALRAAAEAVAPKPGPVSATGSAEQSAAPAVDSPDHRRAESVFDRMHLYKDLSDYDSRLSELIEYFGWETAHKADACRRWFFGDDPKHEQFLEKMGISYWEYAVMHQYALFNRFDPGRPDMYWAYDETIRRLESLGGPERLSVLDFGCGLGQVGLGYALDGYRVVSADKVAEELDFCAFMFRNRDLEPNTYQATDDRDYYDTAADGHEYGLVIEWSVFEHIYDLIPAVQKITGGLVQGGMFLTTTLAKDWTPELKEHYIHDAGDEEISDQLFSKETEDFVNDTFQVVDVPSSLAKLLIKR